jgi:hypothetical protein
MPSNWTPGAVVARYRPARRSVRRTPPAIGRPCAGRGARSQRASRLASASSSAICAAISSSVVASILAQSTSGASGA